MDKSRDRQIFKEFAKYSSLNVLGMMGLSCYILADTFFIARGLGTKGLAALNIAIPAYSLMHGLGLMVGVGGATRYSILKQSKDNEKTDHVFSQSMIFVLMLSLPFFLIGLFFSGQATTILGANEQIHATTSVYIKIIMMFAPVFMMNSVLMSFVRNDGNPRLAMTAMLVGSFSNIVLDYVFVFPLRMGMMGAALATAISPIVGMSILSSHFIKNKSGFKFVNTRYNFKTSKDISALGAGTLVSQLASGVTIALFNNVVLHLSDNTGLAAYGVIANIAFVVTAMFAGIADGIQPIISKSYGAADQRGVTKTYHYAIATAISLAIIIYITVFVFAQPIVNVFNKDQSQKLVEIAVRGIRIYFTAFFFVGINVITAIFFSSVDKPKPAIAISSLRGYAFIIPVTLLMSSLFGMDGVWLSVAITEFLTMIISITFYIKNKKKQMSYVEVP